jgi:hypothetical protein
MKSASLVYRFGSWTGPPDVSSCARSSDTCAPRTALSARSLPTSSPEPSPRLPARPRTTLEAVTYADLERSWPISSAVMAQAPLRPTTGAQAPIRPVGRGDLDGPDCANAVANRARGWLKRLFRACVGNTFPGAPRQHCSCCSWTPASRAESMTTTESHGTAALVRSDSGRRSLSPAGSAPDPEASLLRLPGGDQLDQWPFGWRAWVSVGACASESGDEGRMVWVAQVAELPSHCAV